MAYGKLLKLTKLDLKKNTILRMCKASGQNFGRKLRNDTALMIRVSAVMYQTLYLT